MKRRRWRTSAHLLVAALAVASSLGACAQQSPTTTKPPATPVGVPYTYADHEGKLIAVATELPVDVKQLIDGARRLHEEPGLILDREAIYKALHVRVESSRSSKDVRADRVMRQNLIRDGRSGHSNWRDRLEYNEYQDRKSWVVRVVFGFDYGEGIDPCYTSRLVEAYWGKPFVYEPASPHALLREATLPAGASRTGPHDGRPYNTVFFGASADTANVNFGIGRGGCLSTITISKYFKFQEYSDDHVFHQ